MEKQPLTSDEIEKRAKEINKILKKKNAEYKSVLNQKPNLKTDDYVDVIDWIQKLLKKTI